MRTEVVLLWAAVLVACGSSPTPAPTQSSARKADEHQVAASAECESYCDAQYTCVPQIRKQLCVATCQNVIDNGMGICQQTLLARNSCVKQFSCPDWQTHLDTMARAGEDRCMRDEKRMYLHCAGGPQTFACLKDCDAERLCSNLSVDDAETCAVGCMEKFTSAAQRHGFECQTAEVSVALCKGLLTCDQRKEFTTVHDSQLCSKERAILHDACKL
jgi:hypothetical protein